MNTLVYSVAQDSPEFLKLLDEVVGQRQSATVMRDGHPVAQLVPWPSSPATGEGDETLRRWRSLERLSSEEADAFARDLEEIHSHQRQAQAAWSRACRFARTQRIP